MTGDSSQVPPPLGPASRAPASGTVDVPASLRQHVDAHLDKACIEMRNACTERWQDLDAKRQAAREARDELSRFKDRHRLARRGREPALRHPWIVLAAIAVAAAGITSALFGEHSGDRPFAEVPEAALISLLNVVAVGLLGRQIIALIVHAGIARRILGWLCVLLAWLPLAASINLGAAHYRDALREDWPGLVRADSTYVDPVDASAAPPEVRFHRCQNSTGGGSAISNDPDHEALCMLAELDFGLYTYKSYLLFWVGLLAGVLATAVWAFGMADPHPGLGRLEGEWRRCDEARRAAEGDALRAVASIHGAAAEYAVDHLAALARSGDAGARAALARADACRADVENEIHAAAGVRG